MGESSSWASKYSSTSEWSMESGFTGWGAAVQAPSRETTNSSAEFFMRGMVAADVRWQPLQTRVIALERGLLATTGGGRHPSAPTFRAGAHMLVGSQVRRVAVVGGI